jgi:hypothetical protein
MTKVSLDAGTAKRAILDPLEVEPDGVLKAPETEKRSERRKNKFMVRVILEVIYMYK